MNLLSALLGRDRLILAVAGLLALAGMLALNQMPKQEDPSFPYRGGIITTPFPGADAETIARLVARPLERELAQVEGIDEIRTTARQDVAVIFVQLRDDIYDTDAVWTRVRAALLRAESELPAGTLRSDLDDRLIGADAAVYGVVGGDDPIARRHAAIRLRDRLAQVDGVATTRLSGDPGESIRVHVARSELSVLGLDPGQLAVAIGDRAAPSRVGSLEGGGRNLPLSLDLEYTDLDSLAATPIRLPSGDVLPLGAIARIERSTAMPVAQRAYADGEPMVAVEVKAARDSVDVIRFGEAIRAEVQRMAAEIAPLQIREVFYQPAYTQERMSGLFSSLLTAMALILLVIILAMGPRPALVVATILPLVTAATVALYAMGGGVLQQIAVIGMVVALGILVDNAIVMVEAIQRRLDSGDSRDQAQQGAVRELAAPLLAATGTTVAAFLPLLLSSGNTADFTRGIPIAITLSLAVSYLFAVLVTPLIAVRFLKPGGTKAGAASDRLASAAVWLHRSHPRLALARASRRGLA